MHQKNTAKTLSKTIMGDEVEVQVINLLDKKVIFARQNGEVDTTFDVVAPDSTLNIHQNLTAGDVDYIFDKTCLVGNNTNLKVSVLVNQISKMVYSGHETRNLIVTVCSKLVAGESPFQDFEKIMGVLELLKSLN